MKIIFGFYKPFIDIYWIIKGVIIIIISHGYKKKNGLELSLQETTNHAAQPKRQIIAVSLPIPPWLEELYIFNKNSESEIDLEKQFCDEEILLNSKPNAQKHCLNHQYINNSKNKNSKDLEITKKAYLKDYTYYYSFYQNYIGLKYLNVSINEEGLLLMLEEGAKQVFNSWYFPFKERFIFSFFNFLKSFVANSNYLYRILTCMQGSRTFYINTWKVYNGLIKKYRVIKTEVLNRNTITLNIFICDFILAILCECAALMLIIQTLQNAMNSNNLTIRLSYLGKSLGGLLRIFSTSKLISEDLLL